MKTEKIILWEEEEYNYPLSFGFVPNIVGYVHENHETKRPCILIIPGGAYMFVSETEGEIVAEEFYNKGYQAFVCTYTTNYTQTVPLKQQPLKDVSRAIRYIRANAEKFGVDSEKITICGFSAGGHLSASLLVHYEDIIEDNEKYKDYSNRPDAGILSYPVITSGEKSHRDSIYALIGREQPEEGLKYAALENHVTKQTPPCFIWHTITDDVVPVENSLLFAEACRRENVHHALHLFSEGPHGTSLANEKWASGNIGGLYTKEQNEFLLHAMETGEFPSTEQEIKQLRIRLRIDPDNVLVGKRVWDEIQVWPELAHNWLKTL